MKLFLRVDTDKNTLTPKDIYKFLLNGYYIKYNPDITFCVFYYMNGDGEIYDIGNNAMISDFIITNGNIKNGTITVYKSAKWYEQEFKPTLCYVMLSKFNKYITTIVSYSDGIFMDINNVRYSEVTPLTKEELTNYLNTIGE